MQGGEMTGVFILASYAAGAVAMAIAIAMADSNKRLMRMPYFLRTLGLVLAIIALGIIAPMLQSPFTPLAAQLAINVIFALWSVHRLQDLQWPKWLALLFIVPLVSLIFWLVLCFSPGKGERSAASTA